MPNVQVKSRIKGHPKLVRPVTGGGVINLDNEGYQRAMARMRVSQERHDIKDRIGALESKMDQILSLLSQRHGSGE